MSLTRNGRSFVMTAANDELTGPVMLTSLSFVGTGCTAGQRVTVTDSAGAIIADHYIEASNENVELINNPQWFPGVKFSAAPAAGTYTLVGRFL